MVKSGLDSEDNAVDIELLVDPLLDDSAVEVAVDVSEVEEAWDSHANSGNVEEPDWDADADEVATADEADLEVNSDDSADKVGVVADKVCSDDSIVLGISEEEEEEEEDARKEKRASKPESDEAVVAGLDVAELKPDVLVEVSLEMGEEDLVLCPVAGGVNADAADEDGVCDVARTGSEDSSSVMMESSVVRV
ncbi:hypothetical protein LPJ55_005755 [Coemansia sp. RSA 990]|nr:hypothetical protein LPJ55_005755 [Coemansia sp. RSA 990]